LYGYPYWHSALMFVIMRRRPPRSTHFPYTTLFRSMAANTQTVDDATIQIRLIVNMPAMSPPIKTIRNNNPAIKQRAITKAQYLRSEEHTSELQSRENLVCRLLLEKKKDRNQHRKVQ